MKECCQTLQGLNLNSIKGQDFLPYLKYLKGMVGWCEGVLILRHQGVRLILAYSRARPAILVAGKGRGGNVFILFLHFHFCSSFFPVPLIHLFYYLFYLSSPFFWEMTQNDPQGLMCHQIPTQSIKMSENLTSSFDNLVMCPKCAGRMENSADLDKRIQKKLPFRNSFIWPTLFASA